MTSVRACHAASPLRLVALLTAALLFLLGTDSAHATSIYRHWYAEGYQATGSSGGIPAMTRFGGSVEITGTGFEFSTGLHLAAELDGANQYFKMETALHEETGEIVNVRSTRAKVTVIDDETLLLVYGVATYDAGFSSFSWVAALLTSDAVPVRNEPLTRHPLWAGSYEMIRSEMEENGFQEGISASNEQGSVRLVYDKSRGEYRIIEDDEDLSLSLGSSYEMMKDFYADADPFWRWTSPLIYRGDPVGTLEDGDVVGYFSGYNHLEREDVELLYLGDGRVLFTQCLSLVADGINDYFDAYVKYFGPDTEVPPFLTDSEMACALLIPKSIGIVTELSGDAFVIRDGHRFTLAVNDLLYEGDRVIKGFDPHLPGDTRVKLSLVDGSLLTLSVPFSEILIEKVVKPGGTGFSVVKLIRGVLWTTMPVIASPGKKLEVKTTDATISVNDSEFELAYIADDELGTTQVDVLNGVVNVREIATGSTSTLLVGDSWSASAPMKNAKVTLQRPGHDRGEVEVNGERITVFPHTMIVPRGTELTLVAMPPDDLEFYRWWGAREGFTDEILWIVDGDAVINCEFVMDEDDAEDLYDDEAFDAGLDGLRADVDATPFDDGVPNLLKWAFGMDLGAPDRSMLRIGEDDRKGLPGFQAVQADGTTEFELQFMRRQGGALLYRPMVSDDMVTWRPVEVPESTELTEPGWERVTLSVPVNAGSSAGSFYRVDVEQP